LKGSSSTIRRRKTLGKMSSTVMKRGTIRPINLSGRSKKIRMKKRTNVSVVSYFLDQNGSFVTMKANAKVQAGIIWNALV